MVELSVFPSLICQGILFSFQVLKSFTKLLPSKAIVIRDCEEKQVNTEDLVIGDLVIIRSVLRDNFAIFLMFYFFIGTPVWATSRF